MSWVVPSHRLHDEVEECGQGHRDAHVGRGEGCSPRPSASGALVERSRRNAVAAMECSWRNRITTVEGTRRDAFAVVHFLHVSLRDRSDAVESDLSRIRQIRLTPAPAPFAASYLIARCQGTRGTREGSSLESVVGRGVNYGDVSFLLCSGDV